MTRIRCEIEIFDDGLEYWTCSSKQGAFFQLGFGKCHTAGVLRTSFLLFNDPIPTAARFLYGLYVTKISDAFRYIQN